jgi:adenylosuccinate synthase
MGQRGAEFGATTGRARRCGWLDAVALRRMIELNGVSGLCVTKLDVLDGLEELKICTAYRLDGELLESIPIDSDRWGDIEPVYESFGGWHQPTAGVTEFGKLPQAARDYIDAMERLTGAPAHIISTGPERNENIIRQYPFG